MGVVKYFYFELELGEQRVRISPRFWSLCFDTYEFVECNSDVNVALGSWGNEINKLGPLRIHVLILSRDSNTLAPEFWYSYHAFLSDKPPDSRQKVSVMNCFKIARTQYK
jgi:hypothetical protein